MKWNVGFMGLGIMGVAMARNIAKAGHDLTVYNRTPSRARELIELGAAEATSPKSLAERTDVVIAMLTGPEALDALLWGTDGAAQAFNADKYFINMSTVSPSYTRQLSERLKHSGVHFVDAPVSGSKKPAEDATLVILAGGTGEDVERLTPILLTMGKKVVYCGAAGQGSMMKMSVNLLLGSMMEGLCEAVNFAEVGGLSADAFLDVVSSGPMNCAMFQMKSDMVRKGEFPPQFPLKHMTKDLKFVLDTAYETGAPVPVGQMLLHLYRSGVARNLGEMDFAAVMQLLRDLGSAR